MQRAIAQCAAGGPKPLRASIAAVVGVSRSTVGVARMSITPWAIRARYQLSRGTPCESTPRRSDATRISAAIAARSGARPVVASTAAVKRVSRAASKRGLPGGASGTAAARSPVAWPAALSSGSVATLPPPCGRARRQAAGPPRGARAETRGPKRA